MPGVTIAKSGPQRLRMSAVSCGDATTPSSPAPGSAPPAAAPDPGPIRRRRFRRALPFMLVSTVTAMTSGGGAPRRAAVSCAASRAACIIVSAARRVHVHHPHAQLVAASTAVRDGIRDVVELEVEENAVALVDQRAGRSTGLRSVNSRLPILKPPADAAQRVARARAPRRRSRRRARSGADPRLSPSCVRVDGAGEFCQPRDAVPLHVGAEPSSSFLQMNGSTKFAVPTCTALAPAIMNSSTSSAVAIPPMPMIGSFTARRHS